MHYHVTRLSQRWSSPFVGYSDKSKKIAMLRQSFSPVRCDRCLAEDRRSTLRICNLECVPMKVVERVAIAAHGCAQESTPERDPVLTSRPQVLMMVVGNVPEVVQTVSPDNIGDCRGHSEHENREANVFPGDIPSDDEGVSRQFDRRFSREHSRRIARLLRARRSALRSLPPLHILKANIREKKRTSACERTCRSIQFHPKTPMYTNDIGRRWLRLITSRRH